MTARRLRKKIGSQSAPIFQPPAIGGTTDVGGRDDDAIRAAHYRIHRHPLAALVTLRKEAADEIERLLKFLDDTEGDIESWDDAEPSIAEISATEEMNGHNEDDEDGQDDEPDSECEPSLGWPERIGRSADNGSSLDCEMSPPLSVTDDDRRKFFRRRHGNVKPIPGASWVVA